MTPAISQSPKKIRKQIGSSFWLLTLLVRFAPAEWTGDGPAWVAGGNVISDAELGERLEASQRTIAKWRLRLRAAGLIGWHVDPGRGRVFWIAGVNRAFETLVEVKPAEQKPAVEPVAVKTEPLADVPVASRWLQ